MDNILKAYQLMSASLLKGHFLHSPLFPPNLCDQHGERLHQDIIVMEADIREIFNPEHDW